MPPPPREDRHVGLAVTSLYVSFTKLPLPQQNTACHTQEQAEDGTRIAEGQHAGDEPPEPSGHGRPCQNCVQKQVREIICHRRIVAVECGANPVETRLAGRKRCRTPLSN